MQLINSNSVGPQLKVIDGLTDLGEEGLLSDLGEGDVEDLVARRHLLHDAELAIGEPLLQLGHHVVRLDLGQLRIRLDIFRICWDSDLVRFFHTFCVAQCM